MDSKWIAQVYSDALFIARAQNKMSSLVTVYTDRQGAESRANLAYPQISAQSVAETDDYSNPTEWTKSQIANLTPGEIMAQAIVTDRRLRSDPQNAQSDASTELGNAIADKIESDLLSTFSSLTAGTIGAAGSAITWGHVFAARSNLAGQKVPGPYVCMLHEHQWHQLAKSASVAGAQTNAAAGLIDEVHSRFYVATVGDVDIYTTANITAGTAITTAMWNRQAIALDVRKAPTLEPERDASRRAWELNISADYATGVWRPAFGVQMLFDATAPTS